MSNVYIDEKVLTGIVDSVNKKTNKEAQLLPQDISKEVDSIATLDETLDGDVVAWGRDIPTLKFVDPETQEDKKEILLGSKNTDTVKVDTNSDGVISVESKNSEVATAKMTDKNTFEVTATATEDAKGEISVMVATGTAHRRVMGSLPVIYKKPVPVASLNPVSSVSYTDGLDGLTPAEISTIGKTISDNAEILNSTTVVYFDFGAIHRKISCGKEGYTQVSMPLNSVTYKFNVIGFNHDELTSASAYGSTTATGKAGITFQMADCFNTKYPMNSSNTNVGGWEASIMRTQTMPLLKGYMPSEWQGIIKPVNKISGVGGGASSGLQTTSDELFLLSGGEIFGQSTNSYGQTDERAATPQYPWYSADNVNGRRVKNWNGSACHWWERSALSGYSDYFCLVNSNGDASSYDASLSYGVPFGFCV